MIPYTLIMTSASRPVLLRPTLETLITQVDQVPDQVIIHDDEVFPDQWDEIKTVIRETLTSQNLKVMVHHATPPRRLGLALRWLIANTRTPYVLYSQDDFVTVRPLPIMETLRAMDRWGFHQVRFNKRATMAYKETWKGIWKKQEHLFLSREELLGDESHEPIVFTVSDHWYFQTGLWRVSEIQRALDFWGETPERLHRLAIEEPEGLINHFFDHVAYGGDPENPATRAACQKTFIYGPIGEDRFIRHIGGDRESWAGDHQRHGTIDDAAKAWREIQSYRQGKRRRWRN